MADNFNPYLKWLGIPAKHLPAHHYRLLGLEAFESDPDVIANAADRQMAHIRTFQNGQRAAIAQKLLNELSAAQVCLLDPAKKARYDVRLREHLASQQTAPPLPPTDASPAPPPAVVSPAGYPPGYGAPLPTQPAPLPMSAPQHAAFPQAIAAAPPLPADESEVAGDAPPPAVYTRRGKTGQWVLLGVSMGAAALALIVMFVVLSQLGVGPEQPVAKNRPAPPAVSPTSSTNTPTTGADPATNSNSTVKDPPVANTSDANTSDTATGGAAQQTDEGGSVVTGTTPAVPPAGGNTDADSDNGTTTTTTSTNTTTDPAPNATTAEVALLSPAAIGVLKPDVPYRAGSSIEIRSLSPELEGLKFTQWPVQTEDGFKIEVRQAGRLYVLARPEYLATLGGFSQHAAIPTNYTCELGVVLGPPIACQVVAFDLSPGQYGFNGDLVRPLVAAHEMVLATPDLAVASEPEPAADAGLPNTQIAVPTPTERTPPPSETVQAEIAKRVDSLYFQDAKTPAERHAKAQQLLADAKSSSAAKDDQFVMLQRVLAETSSVGDVASALEAADLLAAEFDVDRTDVRLDAVTRASKVPLPPLAKVQVIAASLPVLEEAIEAERYDEVSRLAGPMASIAQKARDAPLSIKLNDLRKRTGVLESEFRRYQAAQTTLETNATSPEANFAVGAYLCFVKRDWEAGLPHLGLASDAALSAAAKQDLALPETPADHVALAKAWDALAEGRDDRARASLLVRAQYWYRIALPNLAGLEEKGVTDRIAEIDSTVASLGQPAGGGPRRAVIVASADYEFQMYVNGEFLMNGRGAKLSAAPRVLQPGDVIMVKCNNLSGDYGFACTLQFEGTSRYLATGDSHSGWRAYQPASRDQWYNVEGVTSEAEPTVTASTRHQEILKQTGLRCLSIWSGAGRECYLLIRVR